MLLKTVIGGLVRAIIRPERRDVPVMPLRSFVRLPGVFDVTSLVLQVRDLGRLGKIQEKDANSGAYHQQVHDYNAGVTASKVLTTTRRIEPYYEMLSFAFKDNAAKQLLIVGPRNIHELLVAWTRGFRWPNISAIDLYSTNPKIRVMNMEAMTFKDASFDAVSMANTLTYAVETKVALSEVSRVLRPGGFFSFGLTYDPGGSRWKEDSLGAEALAKMLRDLDFEVCIHHPWEKQNAQGRRQTLHEFLVRKADPTKPRLDPFRL